MIHGNITGIRDSMLEELEKLYDAEFERDQYLPDRLLNVLVRFTDQINREMLVYLGRDGEVLEIAVGNIGSIALPELHLRRNLDRLSGFRCIHTHPGGDARLSRRGSCRRCGCFGSTPCAPWAWPTAAATGVCAAFLGEMEYDNLSIVLHGPVKPGRIPQQLWMHEIEMAEERVKRAIAQGGIVEEAEKAMLISTDSEDSLDELAGLAETAGAMVITRVLQNRQKPDPATYIGSGKAEELSLDLSGHGDRSGHLRRRADRRAAAQSGKRAGREGHRPHGTDSGHLRPARPVRRGQAAGGAGADEVSPAPADRARARPCPVWAAASAPAAPAKRVWRWIAGASASASTIWSAI